MKLPEIRTLEGKLLAGVKRRMSFANERTSEIWREFRTRESEIANRIGDVTYSVKVYDDGYSFDSFDPAAEFDKWAAAEVSRPAGSFETLEIPAGEYAVFIHHGTAAEAPRTFRHIFGEWLPASGFQIDPRPHFEVLPRGYNPFDRNAKEEVWIPVRPRV